MLFPQVHCRKIHSTNLVTRLNREIMRRTRVVCRFPSDASELSERIPLMDEVSNWQRGQRASLTIAEHTQDPRNPQWVVLFHRPRSSRRDDALQVT